MQVIKCDITGTIDVPMINVSKYPSAHCDLVATSMLIQGERVEYVISIHNVNGYQAVDVAEEYVLAEMIGLMTKRLNEIRNPSVNQQIEEKPTAEIKLTSG